MTGKSGKGIYTTMDLLFCLIANDGPVGYYYFLHDSLWHNIAVLLISNSIVEIIL